MKHSKTIRASFTLGALLLGLHTIGAARADSLSPTAGFCAVVNAMDGKTDGGGKSPLGDDLAAITISLGVINGILHSYMAVDVRRFSTKQDSDNANNVLNAIKPFETFITAIGTFVKSFLPLSTKLSQVLGLADGRVGMLPKTQPPMTNWEYFLKRFVRGGMTTIQLSKSYLNAYPHVRFFKFYADYIYRGVLGLEALALSMRVAAAGVCDQVTLFGDICKNNNKSCSLPTSEPPPQTLAANDWLPTRRARPASVCAMTDSDKINRFTALYESNKGSLAQMTAGAAKFRAFIKKWASPLKALAGVFKPFESALKTVNDVLSPMAIVMKPIGDFSGAINSLLNKKLCFMKGSCFKLSDIPNALKKFGKKVTKPLMKKANKLFDKLVQKILNALPTPPGMDTITSLIDKFGDLGAKVTSFADELLTSFDVPITDWVEDLKTMSTDLAAIK